MVDDRLVAAVGAENIINQQYKDNIKLEARIGTLEICFDELLVSVQGWIGDIKVAEWRKRSGVEA